MGALPSGRGLPGLVFALAVAATFLLAGCGGEDRLSEEEASQQITELVGDLSGEIQQQFHPIFQQLEGVGENAPVPERVRAQLEDRTSVVADELREAADQVEELNPPEQAEDAVDALAESAREQATRVEELPEQEGLTVRELADAIEPPAQELRRLNEAGLEINPPGQSG
jgi:methyl-accepting chemotaxis protein